MHSSSFPEENLVSDVNYWLQEFIQAFSSAISTSFHPDKRVN